MIGLEGSRTALPRGSEDSEWRYRVAGALAASLAAVAGCGGGLPLLHPAQTLDPGQVRVSAGFAANVATGRFADALRTATSEAAMNPNGAARTAPDDAYAKGALVAASVAPGIAPWLGARVGIWTRGEGGLAYTGRAVRADVRQSFDLSKHWSVSVGAGGSAALHGGQIDDALPGLDLGDLRGWGADVPLLIGYASDGDLYMVWLGGRGGGEQVDIGRLSSASNPPASGAPSLSLSATRFWGGGLVGLAVGFRHLHVAMELDVSYASVRGDYAGTHAQVAGLMLTPASCIWWGFH